MLIREQVALAPFTTLGVGGPARYFVEAHGESEVIEAVEFARSRQLPLFVLGGGSNLVIADKRLRRPCAQGRDLQLVELHAAA